MTATLGPDGYVVTPVDTFTDNHGPSQRLRVDPGQTGFFAGRMFRTFAQGLMPVAGPSVQFRFTSPIDFIVWLNRLTVTQGAVQLDVYAGATSSGTWTALPVIPMNSMASRPQPYYTPVCLPETGGDFTGGTLIDPMKLRASSANNTANNVGGEFSERGRPASILHARLSTLAGGLTPNDAAQWTWNMQWEERP